MKEKKELKGERLNGKNLEKVAGGRNEKSKWLKNQNGFGFVTTDEGNDVFAYYGANKSCQYYGDPKCFSCKWHGTDSCDSNSRTVEYEPK